MYITKEIIDEFKVKFPFAYALYQNNSTGRPFVAYKGKKNEEVETDIRAFLKEKFSPSVSITIVFSEKHLSIEEVREMVVRA